MERTPPFKVINVSRPLPLAGANEAFASSLAIPPAGDKLVVVDYSTSWCGPCKIIAPKFDEFSEQYQNVDFLKVRTDTILPFHQI